MFQDFPENNKSDDFLDDFRQKIASQSMDDIEDKRNELKRSKNVFIGAVSGMALALVVGWLVLAPRYNEGDVPEIPVVRRPQTAVKVQPADPGGMEILNQDKSVYDIVEKKAEEEKVVENLLPPPEEPKIPEIIETDVMADDTSSPQSDVVDAIIAEAETQEQNNAPVRQSPAAQKTAAAQVKANDIAKEKPQQPVQKREDIAKEINDIIKVQESIQNKPKTYADAALTQAKLNEPRRIEKVEAKAPSEFDSEFDTPVIPAKKENVKAAEKVAATAKQSPAPAGVWQLQIMASQNKAAIEKAYAPLAKKYTILAGHPFEVEEADLGAKGMFYRLKIGEFRNKAGADSLCKDLKAMGGTCIVKKK